MPPDGAPVITTLLVVTGTRADFGLWRPVLDEARRAGMRVRLLVTGMHLDPRFGATVNEVRASGHPIAAEVPCTAEGDTRAQMAVSLGVALQGMTPVIEREKPDWLLALGDRGEQLAAALAALHLGMRVAHLHGGERTLGAIDDVLRDLISRLAALHFVATDDARRRLIGIGIDPASVEVTGAPGLDAIRTRDRSQDAEILARYGVAHAPYAVVVQHPETIGDADAAAQLAATVAAVAEVGVRAVAVFPNADAGGRAMAALLERHADTLALHRSIPHDDFLALMAGASAMIGNSSSGIIEAPLLGLPAVNVGARQEGRTRGDNVIDVPADTPAIAAALRRALDPSFRAGLSRRSPYGDGQAAGRIVAAIARASERPRA